MSIRNKVALLALSGAGLVGIAQYEGYSSTAYKDQVGVYTVGFGTTDGVTSATKTDPVRALIKLSGDVSKAEKALAKCFGDAELTQNEWDSYVSLAYNVGSGAVCKSSIVRKLKAKQYDAACKTILDFNKTCSYKNGKKVCVVNKGLDARRKKEYATCTKQ